MLVQAAHLPNVSREQYDQFLHSGWFRGSGMLYRSEFVCVEQQVYSVVNIRLPLASFIFRKRQRKLIRDVERQFRVVIGSPVFNEERERLYQQHMDGFKAFIHSSLEDIVVGRGQTLRIETKEIAVYDGTRLIAVSYFDIGHKVIASIMAVYDKTYSKHSLGYYTMLKEVQWAQENAFTHYFPGYVMDRPSEFDYKLRLGEYEWLDAMKIWQSWPEDHRFDSKAILLNNRLDELKEYFVERGIVFREKIYPYFTTGYIFQAPELLLKYPRYLEIKDEDIIYAASYDVEKHLYMMQQIVPTNKYDAFLNLNMSNDYRQGDLYEMRLMMVVGTTPIFL